MKRSLLTVLLISYFAANAQKETAIAMQALKNVIGSDLNGYLMYSSPTDNYGIGTICIRQWVPKGDMMCDMVKTYGLTDIPPSNPKWKDVNGYAFYGMPNPLTIDDSTSRALGIGLMLPKILQVLNINASFDLKKSRGIHLVIDSAVKRFLNYNEWRSFVESGKDINLTKAWAQGRLRVATSDYVLLAYHLEVDPLDTLGSSIQVKVDSLLRNAPNLLTGQDSLGFKFSKESSGKLTISSNHPVIIAVLVRKQKDLGGRSGSDNGFKDWDVVNANEIINTEIIDPSEYTKHKF
jgi:hypothetical protein